MSDDFEPRVQRWLRKRGEVDPATVEAVAGRVAGLPPRRTGPRRGWLMTAAAAALVVVAVSVGILVLPRSSGGHVPVPPDPAAFVGDPRLASCFGGAGEVQYAFELTHARDYQRYLPNMLLAPELDVDDPAFVVVFGQGVRPNIGILGAPGISTGPQTAPPASHRYVCVFAAGFPNLYSDVDIDGFRATIDGSSTVPTSSVAALPDPEPTLSGPTAEPAPAWSADLAGQLDCEGAIPEFGGEVGEFPAMEPASSPDAALKALLAPGAFASLPAGGFEPAQVEGHWARHDYFVDGRRKALVVTSDRVEGIPDGSGWFVVGVRSCDASEFDPADGRTFDQTLWLSASGKTARSDIIHSSPGPGHCGWESVIFLQFDGAQYLRDPSGVLADSTIVPFDRHASLPGNADDTGYHTADWRLFTVPDGDAVYIKTKDGTFERWGRAREEVGCA